MTDATTPTPSHDEDVLSTLRRCLTIAEGMHSTLGDLQLTTGVVGTAKRLAEKLDYTITVYERAGRDGVDTPLERLAMNAWRISVVAVDGPPPVDFPSREAWLNLDDGTRSRFRHAVVRFQAASDGVPA